MTYRRSMARKRKRGDRGDIQVGEVTLVPILGADPTTASQEPLTL